MVGAPSAAGVAQASQITEKLLRGTDYYFFSSSLSWHPPRDIKKYINSHYRGILNKLRSNTTAVCKLRPGVLACCSGPLVILCTSALYCMLFGVFPFYVECVHFTVYCKVLYCM